MMRAMVGYVQQERTQRQRVVTQPHRSAQVVLREGVNKLLKPLSWDTSNALRTAPSP